MTNTTQLMRQALDALEYHRDQTRPIFSTQETIDAIRAYLAAPHPQDEPIGEVVISTDVLGQGGVQVVKWAGNAPATKVGMKLYAAPLEAPCAPPGWREALQFYADGNHFNISGDPSAWDTTSGEPNNFWCDEAGTATMEDGTVAKMALRGMSLQNEDEDSATSAERPDYDEAVEALRKALNALPRYSFLLDSAGNVRRVPDRYGAWIEWRAAHELFDPVVVDALVAKSQAQAAVDAARAKP